MRTGVRGRSVAGVVGGAVVGGVVAARAARAVDARWAAADGDCPPDECLLPAGSSLTVQTDDGAELAVSVVGPDDGPTVSLAHCWMGGREVWAPVARRLAAAGRRVVLYDQRGHGSSSVGSDGFTIQRLGADLAAVLSAVDAQDAVVAGHSMGGMTVMSLATHDPSVLRDRARAVVLVSTGATGLTRGKALDGVNQRVIGSAALERAMRSSFGHALVRSAVGRSVRRRDLLVTRDFVVACSPEARRGWLAAINGMDVTAGLEKIDKPTTVVVGSWDTMTPPRYAKEIVGAVAGAELRVLPRFGHMLPLEAPDEVAAVILAH